MPRRIAFPALVVAALVGSSALQAFPLTAAPASAADAWTSVWTAPMQDASSLVASDFTCRHIARTSATGEQIRVTLSNEFVTTPTTFDAVTVAAHTGGGGIAAGSTESVTFGGSASVTVPAGQTVTSDAIAFPVEHGDEIAVSTYVAGTIAQFPNHAEGNVTQHCTAFDGSAGNRVGDVATTAWPGHGTNVAWLSGVEVADAGGAIVAFGDSITDGFGASVDAYATWPDLLAVRLASADPATAVVNAGISGNRLTAAGGAGPTGLDRLDRDVLAQAGARTVIVLLGSNDIAGGADAVTVVDGLQKIADEARTAGLWVVGGTLLPRHGGWGGDDAAKDSVRGEVNEFIRSSGAFDAVVDFDAVMRNTDPDYPAPDSPDAAEWLNPAYEVGDRVHPNDAGYAAMAAAIDLTLLRAPAGAISIDAAGVNGIVSHSTLGQMMEAGYPNMNGAWAERVLNRSLEMSDLDRPAGWHDAFRGTALRTELWTPVSLDDADAGTVVVEDGVVEITAAEPGRFGLLSRDIARSDRARVSVEARIAAASGQNALIGLYGGEGAGDFSHNVEFGIENGSAVVFADGAAPWTGTAVSLPADFRIEATPGASRTLDFFVNDALVHTITGYGALPAPYRAFAYGHTGTASFDRIAAWTDATYDAFDDGVLSSRWTPTRLEGANDGTVSAAGGRLTVTGAPAGRYGALSAYLENSAVDWTSVKTTLVSQSGTNALMSIYGGDGGFDDFVEFGVEDGVARVFTSSGPGGFTGGAVSLPAELEVQVGPSWANGRTLRFLVNGSVVHTIQDSTDVPEDDFRVFLYGYGASTSVWDDVRVEQRHWNDIVASTYDVDGGLNSLWAQVALEGGYGSTSQSGGRVTITGAPDSRFGVLSKIVDESDLYGYAVEAKLDSISGTNGLLSLYGGTGEGDFSKTVEFGIEGGQLRVFEAGAAPWTGGAAVTPAVLRVEVSAPDDGGARDLDFFYDDRLVHSIDGSEAIGGGEFRTFLYGYGATTTTWDHQTFAKLGTNWEEDGHASRATYEQVRGDALNGDRFQRVHIQAGDGRKGISQRGLALQAGHQYRVEAYVRGDVGPVDIELGPATGDGPGYSEYDGTTTAAVTGSWTKATAVLTPDTTDLLGKLFIGAEGEGTLDIDMVSVMPLDESEAVLGGWRADFVETLEEMKLSSVRWPGGIIADWYDWSDGVGPRAERAPTFYAEWDAQWLTNDVGTHEILDLAEALGIELDLQVNWGRGTPEQAADWVEYVNASTSSARAANGRTEPWNIRNWGIGNETWGFWTPGWTPDATAFAASYDDFATAMLAADPGIELFADADDGSTTAQARNIALLGTGKVDHLAPHIYAPQTLPLDYDDGFVFAASNGVPANLADILAVTEQSIVQHTSEDVKVAMTEYSANYLNDAMGRAQSLEGALQTAANTNYFLRRPDLLEVNDISGLVNLWEGGGIRIGNRGLYQTATHHVMSMQANHVGDVLLPTEVSSDTFDAPAMGNMPARAGVPYLDVTTTRSADGSRIYLSVVNRHPSAAITASIEIDGTTSIASTGTVHELNSGSYLNVNSWADPDVVAPTSAMLSGLGSSFSHEFPAHSFTIIELETVAPSTNGTVISGYVYDESTFAAVSGATVSVPGAGTTTTDARGRYLITVPGDATYSITVSGAGYATKTRTGIEVRGVGATANSIPLGH